MSGVCTLVSQCALALAALKKGRAHKMKRCGFSTEDDEEIICCPNTGIIIKSPVDETTPGTHTRGSVKRKSAACKYFK